MKIPKYKQLKNLIEERKSELNLLKEQLKKTCPHNKIKYESYCNDDWAQSKKYTRYYVCEFCGLSTSYDEESGKKESDLYKKMEQLYDKKKYKRLGIKR